MAALFTFTDTLVAASGQTEVVLRDARINNHLVAHAQDILDGQLSENPIERQRALDDIAILIATLKADNGRTQAYLEADRTLLALLESRVNRLSDQVQQTRKDLMQLERAHSRASESLCTRKLKRAIAYALPILCAGFVAMVASHP